MYKSLRHGLIFQAVNPIPVMVKGWINERKLGLLTMAESGVPQDLRPQKETLKNGNLFRYEGECAGMQFFTMANEDGIFAGDLQWFTQADMDGFLTKYKPVLIQDKRNLMEGVKLRATREVRVHIDHRNIKLLPKEVREDEAYGMCKYTIKEGEILFFEASNDWDMTHFGLNYGELSHPWFTIQDGDRMRATKSRGFEIIY